MVYKSILFSYNIRILKFHQFHSVDMVYCLIHIYLVFNKIDKLFMYLWIICIPLSWIEYSDTSLIVQLEYLFLKLIYIDSDY